MGRQINIKNINKVIDRLKPKQKPKGWQVRPKDIRRLQRWEKFNLNNAKQVWSNFEDVGLFALNMQKRNGPWDEVRNVWKGMPCFVVGSSISARGFDLTKLNGFNSIGVNHMIESYHGFKFFLFQDQRFLRITTYDLKKYKGRIFSHNSAPILPMDYDKITFFKTQYNRGGNGITLDPEKGLYPRCLTGAAALHLALMTGANPIYMIGLDTPKEFDMKDGHHYNKDYTGEHNTERSLKGTLGKYGLFQAFYKWKDRIVNVCPDGYIDIFKKISFEELDKILGVNE